MLKKLIKKIFWKKIFGSRYKSPSFDKVAELYGAKGFKVKKISEISEAVHEAIKCNKPSVVDIDVDPSALYSFRRDSFKHSKDKCHKKISAIKFQFIN